jgi:hypothetical protein
VNAGGKCPYCLWAIETDESIVACVHCGVQFHSECWEANGSGCATFGCAGGVDPPGFVLASSPRQPATTFGAPPVLAPSSPWAPPATVQSGGFAPSLVDSVADALIGRDARADPVVVQQQVPTEAPTITELPRTILQADNRTPSARRNFCDQCGNRISFDDLFCGSCGARLEVHM